MVKMGGSQTLVSDPPGQLVKAQMGDTPKFWPIRPFGGSTTNKVDWMPIQLVCWLAIWSKNRVQGHRFLKIARPHVLIISSHWFHKIESDWFIPTNQMNLYHLLRQMVWYQRNKQSLKLFVFLLITKDGKSSYSVRGTKKILSGSENHSLAHFLSSPCFTHQKDKVWTTNLWVLYLLIID